MTLLFPAVPAKLAVLDPDTGGPEAAALAERLGVPLVWEPGAEGAELLLAWADGALRLQPADARCGPVCVDFASATARQRLQGAAELVVRAVRGRSREPLQVVDATAGLGRDAFVLAARGLTVTMLEQSPAVAALLADGLRRALLSPDASVAIAASNLSLTCVEAAQWLTAADCQPDVVYLDPMFPDERKTALPRKEMQLFQQLLDHGPEDPALLEAARGAARLRVVVKRPVKGPPLAGLKPAYALTGTAVRFDVYTPLASQGGTA